MMEWMAPLRHLGAKMLGGQRPPANGEPSMGEITTIGLDLAKHVFQVHGVDAKRAAVLRKQLRRGQVLAFFSKLPPCVVGLEGTKQRSARRRSMDRPAPWCRSFPPSRSRIPSAAACRAPALPETRRNRRPPPTPSR